MKDGSFEAQKSGWNLTASKDSGKISVIADKSGVLSGSKALEVLSQSTSAGTDHGYSSATQTVELEVEYNLYIKQENQNRSCEIKSLL